MRFADFRQGMIIEVGPRRVDEAEMVAFARKYDPQWFHVDSYAAQRGRFGALVASSWLLCGIGMEMMVRAVLHDSESFAGPGLENMCCPHPVYPGDELNLKIEVLEARVSRTQPELGILRYRWLMSNQNGKDVLDLSLTTLFNLKPGYLA